MKALLVLLGVLSLPTESGAVNVPSQCRNSSDIQRMPLRQHIDCMGNLLMAASSGLSDQNRRQEVADDLMDVRRHLQTTIGMTPKRMLAFPPELRRLPMLEYYTLSAEAMLLVSKLEGKILNTRYWDSPSADIGVYELSQRLDRVVNTAYQKYGD